MSYRCTMSRIRWFSGSTVLAIALVGTACRSESERAEGAVREPGDRTTSNKIAPPEGQNQKPGQEPRGQAERVGDKAEQLAREGQELGREAREQAERVGEKAEQLAERGREVGREANEQMNRVGEQTGALKDDRGSGAREQAAPTPAARDQGAAQGQTQGREAQGHMQGREAQGQTQGRAAQGQTQGREAQGQTQGREAQGHTQGREAQGQTGGARDKDQAGGAAASTRDAWTQEAKDNDYQVSFNRDGSVVATKEAKGSGERLADEALRNAVGGKLADSDHETVKKLSVTVHNGVVTLQGNVASVKEATEAVKEAMEAKGVTKVISQIRYGSSP
ncbi:BON domain-containing protein [Sorangium sp. So ce185]|uniref:BON domain-containing protein n=1 Tax=Sorangium sp. So ce185 TaxID=3133287 RepID=UPI003F5E9608